jgi:hypothetical protein
LHCRWCCHNSQGRNGQGEDKWWRGGVEGDQVEKVLSKGRRNEYAGKIIFLKRVEKIFDCGDENFF